MVPLTKFSRTIYSYIVSLVNSGEAHSKLTTVCLAKAIADHLPLAPVENHNVGNYYRANLGIQVLGIISDINELCVIDTEGVEELVFQYYSYRYKVAFNPSVVLMVSEDSAILDFFGISNAYDYDSLMKVKHDHLKAMKHYNSFSKLLDERSAILTEKAG